MERLAKQVVQCITNEYSLDESRQEILLFGIQSVMEMGINIFVSILILIKMNMVLEGITFFCIFIPLRMLAGGYHLDSYLGCFLFSCLTLIGVMVLSRSLHLNEDMLLTLILIAELLIGMLGPTVNSERPVSKSEYIVFTKRLAKLFVVIAGVSIAVRYSTFAELLNVIFLSLCLVFITSIMGKIKYRQDQI